MFCVIKPHDDTKQQCQRCGRIYVTTKKRLFHTCSVPGLGDRVAWAISLFCEPKKKCKRCGRRQTWLNERGWEWLGL